MSRKFLSVAMLVAVFSLILGVADAQACHRNCRNRGYRQNRNCGHNHCGQNHCGNGCYGYQQAGNYSY